MRKNRGELWDKLLTFCSPDYNTNPTTAVRNVCQDYSDKDTNSQCMSINDYTDTFMQTLGTIIEHKILRLNFDAQYSIAPNDNLKMQVEAVYDAHIEPQTNTCDV